MAQDKEKPKIRTVLCPECDTETTLDPETGDGDCPKCGLPVGAVVKRRRVDRALEVMREREEAERKKSKKSGWEI